jgi:hypothetical protein
MGRQQPGNIKVYTSHAASEVRSWRANAFIGEGNTHLGLFIILASTVKNQSKTRGQSFVWA